jgi:hypothetical protein
VRELRIASSEDAVSRGIDAQFLLERCGDVDIGQYAETFLLELLGCASDRLVERHRDCTAEADSSTHSITSSIGRDVTPQPTNDTSTPCADKAVREVGGYAECGSRVGTAVTASTGEPREKFSVNHPDGSAEFLATPSYPATQAASL